MTVVDAHCEVLDASTPDLEVVSVADLVDRYDPSDLDSLASLAVQVTVDDKVESLAPYAQHLGLIELVFPQFKDGRPYSTAVILRRDYGYKNDLRASGDFLPDQALFLLRSGFSSFEVSEQFSLAQFQASLKAYTTAYQPAEGGRLDQIADLRQTAAKVEAA